MFWDHFRATIALEGKDVSKENRHLFRIPVSCIHIYSISTIAGIIIVESKWNVQRARPKCPATAWSFPATCTMGNSDRCKYDNHVELTNQHLLKGGI